MRSRLPSGKRQGSINQQRFAGKFRKARPEMAGLFFGPGMRDPHTGQITVSFMEIMCYFIFW